MAEEYSLKTPDPAEARRYWLGAGGLTLAVVVTAGVLLSVVFIVGGLTSSAADSPQATASSGPPVLTEVPASIPAGGVQVGFLVLMRQR
jgi:hypothetical protein